MKALQKSVAVKAGLAVVVAIAIGLAIWTKATGPGKGASTGADRRDNTGNSTPVAVAAPSIELSERQAASIKTAQAESREFAIYKVSVGTIDFNEDLLVQVFSQYSGKIIKAVPNVGDDVKQGDILFTIDSPDLLQAESTLLASAGVLELQRRNLARATNLLKSGGSAQRDVDQSTSDEQTAEGNLKAARDSVRIFGKTDAEIDQIVLMRKLDATLLVPSPISGRVVTRNASPGLFTQPGNAPAPYSIADVSTMWMIANVIETDAPAYKLGQDVEARVAAYPGVTFKGRVTTLGSTIDPNTRRQLVRSVINDPDHLLRSGMYASFITKVGDAVRSIAVPANGVIREGDGTMTVWVTTDHRRYINRTVKVGLQQDGWVQILEGLQENETVVTDGAVFLSNKLAVGDSG